MNVFTIKDLKKIYKNVSVIDIDQLEIRAGECFGLVGNNGAGKTTLFRLMLDLIQASSGTVHFEDSLVSENENWKAVVGAYLDENMLLTYLTPDEYFETLRKIYGMSATDLADHIAQFEVLFNGEITGKKKYIRDLSKGNIKKVGIAAALMNNPQAVLLDEPFENLDPSSQSKLKRLIEEYKTQKNTSFLISSHDLNHVTEIADRIVVLEKGSILKDLADKSRMVSELEAYFE